MHPSDARAFCCVGVRRLSRYEGRRLDCGRCGVAPAAGMRGECRRGLAAVGCVTLCPGAGLRLRRRAALVAAAQDHPNDPDDQNDRADQYQEEGNVADEPNGQRAKHLAELGKVVEEIIEEAHNTIVDFKLDKYVSTRKAIEIVKAGVRK